MKGLLAVLAILSATLPAAAQGEADILSGKAIIEANCAGCHAIEAADTSPHPDAPAFRTLHEKYPLESLEEAFAEGIYTGHPDMPEFEATPRQITDIIAYISSLSGD